MVYCDWVWHFWYWEGSFDSYSKHFQAFPGNSPFAGFFYGLFCNLTHQLILLIIILVGMQFTGIFHGHFSLVWSIYRVSIGDFFVGFCPFTTPWFWGHHDFFSGFVFVRSWSWLWQKRMLHVSQRHSWGVHLGGLGISRGKPMWDTRAPCPDPHTHTIPLLQGILDWAWYCWWFRNPKQSPGMYKTM